MITARRPWELTREERDKKVQANTRKFAEMDDATLALQLHGMLVIFSETHENYWRVLEAARRLDG